LALSTPSSNRPVWRKSSHSNGAGGECVEVVQVQSGIAMRDSKASKGLILTVTPATWRAFITGIKTGQYDL
jgi:hypothetical protein